MLNAVSQAQLNQRQLLITKQFRNLDHELKIVCFFLNSMVHTAVYLKNGLIEIIHLTRQIS